MKTRRQERKEGKRRGEEDMVTRMAGADRRKGNWRVVLKWPWA